MAQEKQKPFEVTDALTQLGLAENIIIQAVLDGEMERDLCTAHHPKIMPGFVSWGTVIRSLRDQLIVLGWTCAEDRNYPTVVNEAKTVALAVATGDDNTGRAGLFPNVKNARGVVTKNVVLLNQRSLFDVLPEFRKANKPCVTWLLLRNRVGDRIYFELSLPARMNNEGFILEWDTRIIFEPMDIDGDVILAGDSSNDATEFDVPVIRKASI